MRARRLPAPAARWRLKSFHVILPKSELHLLREALHAAPHSILGMHPITRRRVKGVVARAFLRDVETCEVVDLEASPAAVFLMERVADEGLFEVFVPGRERVFRHQLRATRAIAPGTEVLVDYLGDKLGVPASVRNSPEERAVLMDEIKNQQQQAAVAQATMAQAAAQQGMPMGAPA
mgnify:CR=1 FL=1